MWSNQYIGIPYKAGGRDRSGLDCWGLARLIYQEQYRINLPSFSTEYTENDTERMSDLIAQYREGWQQTDKASEGDLVLFRVLGSESHIGIAISEDSFIHVRENSDTCVEKLNSAAWEKRIVGFFKYAPNKGALLNAIPHPLKTERVTIPIPAGITISQLVEWVTKEYKVQEELAPNIVILVNGIPIKKEYWDTLVLKDSDAIEYRVVAGKSAVRTVAFIALAIYAPVLAGQLTGYTAAASAATLLGTSVTTSLVVANAVVTAGLVLAGSALINAIAPIRPPSAPTDPGQAERMYMFEGSTNQRRVYDAIPVILGKVRMTPPLGANSFTYYQSEREQYLRMLLVWGYGPLVIDESTLKIGDTAWTNYEDTKKVTLNRITEPTTAEQASFDALYGTDVEQIYKNITLTAVGTDVNNQPAPATTPYAADNEITVTFDTVQADSASVIIHFPEGLRSVNKSSGDSSFVDVTIRIAASRDGGLTWYNTNDYTVASVTGSSSYRKDAFSVTITNTSWTATSSQTLTLKISRITSSTKENSSAAYYYSSVLQSVQKVINTKPTVDPTGVKIAKTALEIKATGQLSGNIEGISAVVQSYCRIYSNGNWDTYAGTSNPAALFLYVVTHPGNIQKISSADEANSIDLTQLGYWYNYCVTKGFEYNSVVGTQKSLLETLRDICAAGRASPAIVNGKWTVNIDEPKTVIAQHFSPHNSWGFESTKLLPKIPDGVKVKFFDETNNYEENEVTVYNNGKTYTTATVFESITLPGVTKSSLAIDHAKWQLSQAKVRPEVYSLNTDLEYLVCTRGDRVKVMHDVPMWGLGSGRIRTRISQYLYELDEPISIQDTSLTHEIRIRGKTNTSISSSIKATWTATQYQKSNGIVTLTIGEHPFTVGDTVNTSISVSGTLNTSLSVTNGTILTVGSTTISYAASGTSTMTSGTPSSSTISLTASNYKRVQLVTGQLQANADAGDLFLFGQITQESQDLIVLSIEPTSNKTGKLTLVDYGVTSTYNLFTDYSSIIDTSYIKYDAFAAFSDTITLTTMSPHNVVVGDRITVPDRYTPAGPSSLLTVTNATVTAVTSNTISYFKSGSGTISTINTGPYYGTITLVGGVSFETQLSSIPYNYRNSVATAIPIISNVVSDESVLEVVGPGSFVVKMVVSLVPAAQNNMLPPNIQFIEVGYDLTSGNYSTGSKLVKGNFIDGYVELPGVTEGVTYKLKARYITSSGIAGPWSSETTHTVVGKTTKPNTVSGFSATISQTTGIILSWTANTEKDLFGYEIRTSNINWGDSNCIWKGQGTSLPIAITNLMYGQTVTYYIKALDYNKNYSLNTASATVSLVAPNIVTNLKYVYGTSLTVSTVTVSWTAAVVPTNGTPIKNYKFEITKPNGASIDPIYTDSTSVTIPADWLGSATVKVTTYNTLNVSSSSYAQLAVVKEKPNPVTDISANVIDNNVLIYWKLPVVSSLPISHIKISRGDTYASSTLIGTKSGQFTSLFENSSGTYTYWLVAVDTDNRESDPVFITKQVSQPPDFILNLDYPSTFNTSTKAITSTKVNSSVISDNSGNQLLMLVNSTETWAQHFTNNSKTNIQGFIDAGYTYYISPASGITSASYTEVIDAGTQLASSSINVSLLTENISGTPTVSVSISTSTNNITWSTPISSTSIFATEFRYVKVIVTVTENAASDLLLLKSLTTRLDSKLKNDAGKLAVLASDTYGTIANFNTNSVFADVTSITVTPTGTTPLIAVYDYKDVNLTGTYSISGTTVTVTITNHGLITGQRVKLYYSSGSGVNGVYTITKINDNSYTVTNPVSGSAGGNLSSYSQSMRIYVYDTSGTRQDCPQVSWSVKGY